MKKRKLYQNLTSVIDQTIKERPVYYLLNCYCDIMHTFIDEMKTQCDAQEEPEPQEI